MDKNFTIPDKPFILDSINKNFLQKHNILPVKEDEDNLYVLISNNTDFGSICALERIFEKNIETDIVENDEIQRILYKWYEAQLGNVDETSEDLDLLINDLEQLKDLAQEAPIIRLVNNYISYALETNASDIHFEPTREYLKVRFRIDGILHEIERLSKKVQPAIISRIKLMSNMNIAENRVPQDGRVIVEQDDMEIDIRVSAIPTIYGESMVLRLLKKDTQILNLSNLGMNDKQVKIFEEIIHKPYGIILVTGPTGSGKTTTLYAALTEINTGEKKIITVEDPVEYQLEGINQIQVKPQIGLTFDSALRSILRQDPDVILIGEIRDLETASIAIQSALTGHLVFSTLHTNDAFSAFNRLVDLGVENYLLTSAIIASIGQRLIRTICPYCKEEAEIDGSYVKLLKNYGFDITKYTDKVYRGRGCKKCANTGFRGRTAIYEILYYSDDLKRDLMSSEYDESEIFKLARERGFITMRDDGFLKVIEGVTTIEEVLRVTR